MDLVSDIQRFLFEPFAPLNAIGSGISTLFPNAPTINPQTGLPYSSFLTVPPGFIQQPSNEPNRGAIGAVNEFLFGESEGVPIFQQNPGALDLAGFGTIEKIALIAVGGLVLWKVLSK